MKHNIKNKKLNKTSSHRKAMFMNMSNSLIKHEQITTTLPKAKELKRFVEKIITLGKKGDLESRRKTISILQDQKMAKKTFDVLADRYKERNGGYTRIIKLGNRFGDNAPTAVIEFHGTSDFDRPYDGISDYYASVEDMLNHWTSFNHTTKDPLTNSITDNGTLIEYYAYNYGDSGTSVEHYKVVEGDHVWFDLSYEQANTSEIIWNFVSKYDLNGLR